MGHLLGYARVSTTDQQPHLQVDALTAAGCYRVFTETASGARADRPTSRRSWYERREALVCAMAYNFLRGDPDQPFLLPPDLRDWLPADHLASAPAPAVRATALGAAAPRGW